MAYNLFARLRELVPLPSVIVGKVIAINDDNTSTVEIPGSIPLTGVAANVATGSLIRARGTTVPVGSNAFVRSGVIETQAPDVTALDVPVGTVIVPAPPPYVAPPPPPPAPPPPAPAPSPAVVFQDLFPGPASPPSSEFEGHVPAVLLAGQASWHSVNGTGIWVLIPGGGVQGYQGNQARILGTAGSGPSTYTIVFTLHMGTFKPFSNIVLDFGDRISSSASYRVFITDNGAGALSMQVRYPTAEVVGNVATVPFAASADLIVTVSVTPTTITATCGAVNSTMPVGQSALLNTLNLGIPNEGGFYLKSIVATA